MNLNPGKSYPKIWYQHFDEPHIWYVCTLHSRNIYSIIFPRWFWKKREDKLYFLSCHHNNNSKSSRRWIKRSNRRWILTSALRFNVKWKALDSQPIYAIENLVFFSPIPELIVCWMPNLIRVHYQVIQICMIFFCAQRYLSCHFDFGTDLN